MVRHIVVRPGGLGDTLLMAPSLAAMRAVDGVRVHLVGYPERLAPILAAGLAESIHPLDRWLEAPEAILQEIEPAGGSGKQLRIDSFFRTVPEHRLRHSSARVHEAFPPEGYHAHVAEYLAACLGVRPDASRKSVLTAMHLQPDSSRPTLWIHPGAGAAEKRWPVPHFLSVARTPWIQDRFSIRFVTGEVEGSEFAGPGLEGFPIERPKTPLALARLFKRNDFYLGNDSGPTHLAALSGIHTLAVFGPTDPAVWGPWGTRTKVVRNYNGEGWPDTDEILTALEGLLGKG